MDLVKALTDQYLKPELPEVNVGDTVRVSVKVKEGNRERIQVFEGIVLCMKNAGARRTFTVRKISFGVGVERIFPINSPRIVKVEVVRPGKVRRAKLYYLRDRVGKKAKVKQLVGGAVAAAIAARNARADAAAAQKEAEIKAEQKAEHAAEAAAAKK